MTKANNCTVERIASVQLLLPDALNSLINRYCYRTLPGGGVPCRELSLGEFMDCRDRLRQS